MLTKPKPHGQRARMITQTEYDVHHWLGRLAMCLAISSHEMPTHLQNHVRRTLDEFCRSDAASDTLTRILKEEAKRP